MISRVRFFENARKQELIDLEPAGQEQPDETLEKQQLREAVLSALLLIPKDDAKLLRLLFLDTSEPSYEEISNRLGIPISSIGPNRKRALEKLRKVLKRLNPEI